MSMEVDAISGDYTGSGTIDDPYSGMVCIKDWDYTQPTNPYNLYFTVGTFLEYQIAVGIQDRFSVTDGFGIELKSTTLEGTFTKAGEIAVKNNDQLVGMIYVVEGTPALEFLSDPADGILIPPNHHLLTFNYLDGTTVYRVVEHGGFLDDVPTLNISAGEWYSNELNEGFWNQELAGLPITSDFVFEEKTHSGGGVG